MHEIVAYVIASTAIDCAFALGLWVAFGNPLASLPVACFIAGNAIANTARAISAKLRGAL